MIALLCIVFAFALFVLAAFNIPSRWNLTAAGLAFITLARLFEIGNVFTK